MIQKCLENDFNTIFEIINNAAQKYKNVIPENCWNEPYMSFEKLENEIEDGVVFWGLEHENQLVGVMGIQDKGDVTLIRHAYVLSRTQKSGIGTRLLHYLESVTKGPILIGTWANASWAISFYEKNGYTLVTEEEKNQLLKKYWSISEQQIETSVVLANPAWHNA